MNPHLDALLNQYGFRMHNCLRDLQLSSLTLGVQEQIKMHKVITKGGKAIVNKKHCT
jgi:hypothetical protein